MRQCVSPTRPRYTFARMRGLSDGFIHDVSLFPLSQGVVRHAAMLELSGLSPRQVHDRVNCRQR